MGDKIPADKTKVSARKTGDRPWKLTNNVKFFTNFSCDYYGRLIKHALKFAVGRTIFGSSVFNLLPK
jgi:hypothetical protein